MQEPYAQNIYHHSAFSDISWLVSLKEEKKLKISLAFPTLNEEATIGSEVEMMRRALVQNCSLLDEIAVVDSGSTDRTREVAEDAGADVYIASDYLPDLDGGHGKGENLWKSLYILSGDIIIWLDGDIENIHPKFVCGLLGPLLLRDEIMFVKAFYERPLAFGGNLIDDGGGRVTEILVKPLFACFYPDLSMIFQPCAGEYAARRELLEALPFSMGYGVETGLLIDIYERYGIEPVAQVNLDKRIHRNQSVHSLGKMSFEIIHAFISRLEAKGRISLDGKLKDKFIRACLDQQGVVIKEEEVQIGERPPISTLKEYQERKHLARA